MRAVALMAGLLLVAVAPGCAYFKMLARKAELRLELALEPRLELTREFAPEACFAVQGRLVVEPPAAGREVRQPRPAAPLLLAAVASDASGAPELVTTRPWRPDTLSYSVLLPQGRYVLYALEDLDGDGRFSSDEAVGRSVPVEVGGSLSSDGFIVAGPDIVVDHNRRANVPVPVHVSSSVRDVVVSSLDDPLFDEKVGELGLYDPAHFLAHTQGFVFGMESFDRGKTQVIFVHGAKGTPRDFAAAVATLDRSRFQPWFFYYPSGMPLDKMAAGLAALLRQWPADRIAVVAHSMGGLVARAALGHLCANGRPPGLSAYVSFSAAYGGNDAARMGLKLAPAVVPSWRDVAGGSDFLARVFERPLPRELPFLLLFAWGLPGKEGPNGAGDGVISLKSQLDPRAQREAWRVHGVAEDHMGVLRNPETLARFEEWLAQYAPPGGATTAAAGSGTVRP